MASALVRLHSISNSPLTLTRGRRDASPTAGETPALRFPQPAEAYFPDVLYQFRQAAASLGRL
jgi:hypothetical protein